MMQNCTYMFKTSLIFKKNKIKNMKKKITNNSFMPLSNVPRRGAARRGAARRGAAWRGVAQSGANQSEAEEKMRR